MLFGVILRTCFFPLVQFFSSLVKLETVLIQNQVNWSTDHYLSPLLQSVYEALSSFLSINLIPPTWGSVSTCLVLVTDIFSQSQPIIYTNAHLRGNTPPLAVALWPPPHLARGRPAITVHLDASPILTRFMMSTMAWSAVTLARAYRSQG